MLHRSQFVCCCCVIFDHGIYNVVSALYTLQSTVYTVSDNAEGCKLRINVTTSIQKKKIIPKPFLQNCYISSSLLDFWNTIGRISLTLFMLMASLDIDI